MFVLFVDLPNELNLRTRYFWFVPRGGAYHPLENFSPAPSPPQTKKESDRSDLGNLNYILRGNFDKNGDTPFRWDNINRQNWEVRKEGVVATWAKNLSRHFEKYLHAIQLAEYVRITISSFIRQKPGKIPIFRTFLVKLSFLCLYFTENRLYWVRRWLWRHTFNNIKLIYLKRRNWVIIEHEC